MTVIIELLTGYPVARCGAFRRCDAFRRRGAFRRCGNGRRR
jgi:hypothetical protein